jgi:HEAT repeat protein
MSSRRSPLMRTTWCGRAALGSASRVGSPGALHELGLVALSDPVWEVRVGAVRALNTPEPILPALSDPNLDIRKAAVRALARWATDPQVALALKRAQDDTDADVRAYARRALA